jgi:pyruvate/2-oxoglutarate dehydrogenase complex dihydrolipoamide acyltransferase (E2) component
MAVAIRVPDMGTTVDRVTLLSWLKQEGDAVERGEPICEIETDKAVSELESVAEGILLKQVVEADTEVDQGTVVAYIGEEGESLPDEEAEEAPTSQNEPKKAAAQKKSAAPRVPPLLRNLAKRNDVDLSAIEGTGPEGRITREDIMQAAEAGPAAADTEAEPTQKQAKPSSNQALVAKRVGRSQREIPPIDVTARIDMTAVLQRRQAMADDGNKVSYDAFFVRAVGQILKNHPHFRSRLEDEELTVLEATDVGLAMSVDEDLFIPVVHDAGNMPLEQVQERIAALAQKTRDKQFATEDLQNPTFTISNLGMFPAVESFAAVIPPGQAAILSVGACVETPVIENGELTSAPLAAVTLSVDHRLINGREAAEFITALKNKLEDM